MQKASIFLRFCLLFAPLGGSAQHFVFSQHNALPYLINPAETGALPSEFSNRLVGIFRSHWNLPSPDGGGLQGFGLGWDRRFCVSNSFQWGLGLFGQHDNTFSGGIQNTQFRATASASHTFLGGSWISGGGSVGFLQYDIDPEKLTFDQMWNSETGDFDKAFADAGENFSRQSGLGLGATLGFRVSSMRTRRSTERQGGSSEGWAAGFSIHDLGSSAYSFLPEGVDRTPNRLSPGFTLTANARFPDIHCAPSIFFQKQSFSESRQWLLMPGISGIFRIGDDFLDAGFRLRLANGQAGATPNALVLFGEWRFMGGTLRGSWDIGLSHIGNKPLNGLEVSFATFFGEGKCPIYCD